MKINKKFLIILITILILGGVYLFFGRKNKEALEWRTTAAIIGNVDMTVTATGTVNPVTTVDIGTQVSGTIAKILADYNDHVKKGQMIAVLDTSFLYSAVQDARATRDRALIQMNQAKIDYDRITKLLDTKVIAQADYDQAKTTYEAASTTLNSSQAQLDRANINLEYAKIKTPIKGIVIARNVNVGQTVAASFATPTLFKVADDLTKMQVEADIDESDIGEIIVNEKVIFTVDAYPNKKFEGRVQQIRLQPNIIQNVVNYKVIINAPNADLKLMPGMTANIIVDVESHQNVLKILATSLRFIPSSDIADNCIIPIDPLKDKQKYNFIKSIKEGGQESEILSKSENLNEGDTAYIWIRKGEKMEAAKVMIGISDGTYTEVRGEIKAGDEVVSGISKIVDGPNTKQNPFMPKMPSHKKKKDA